MGAKDRLHDTTLLVAEGRDLRTKDVSREKAIKVHRLMISRSRADGESSKIGRCCDLGSLFRIVLV